MKDFRPVLVSLFLLLALPGSLLAQDAADGGAPVEPPKPAPVAPKPNAPPAKPVTVRFAVMSYAGMGSATYVGAAGPVTVSLKSAKMDFIYPYVGPPDLVIYAGDQVDPANATHCALSTNPLVTQTVLLFAPAQNGGFQVAAVPVDFAMGKVKIVNIAPQPAAFKWGTNPPVELKPNEMKIYTPPSAGNGTGFWLAQSDFGDWGDQGNMGMNLNAKVHNFVFLMNGDYFTALSRKLVWMFVASDGQPTLPAARGAGAAGAAGRGPGAPAPKAGGT